jgi:hypothetical protein
MTALDPQPHLRRPWRSAGAVFAGLLAVFVLSLGTGPPTSSSSRSGPHSGSALGGGSLGQCTTIVPRIPDPAVP